jgi:hypothetical protein
LRPWNNPFLNRVKRRSPYFWKVLIFNPWLTYGNYPNSDLR